jgi:hypothetical protein
MDANDEFYDLMIDRSIHMQRERERKLLLLLLLSSLLSIMIALPSCMGGCMCLS